MCKTNLLLIKYTGLVNLKSEEIIHNYIGVLLVLYTERLTDLMMNLKPLESRFAHSKDRS